jgi:hypothetical protein
MPVATQDYPQPHPSRQRQRPVPSPHSAFAILIAAALLTAGCQSSPHHDGTVVSAERIRDYQLEERQRQAGEDHIVTDDGAAAATARAAWGGLTAIGDLFGKIIERLQGHTPGKAAQLMEDSHNADNRRDGIFRLVDFQVERTDPVVMKRLRQIADVDPNPLVHAAALRALNRCRDKAAALVFIRSIADQDALVRLEAAKALANIPDDHAVPVLLKHLTADDNQDVRIACADALRQFKTLVVGRALAGALTERNFAIAWQARRSLMLMTGRDFRFQQADWLGYFDQNKKPFVG